MYSGMQPSGSISKCLILVALCIFHAESKPFFPFFDSSAHPIRGFHEMYRVRECIFDLLNVTKTKETRDNRGYTLADAKIIIKEETKSKECFDTLVAPESKNDYWPYGYMAYESMRACQWVDEKDGGGFHGWRNDSIKNFKKEGRQSCIYADYAQTGEDYARLLYCVFEKLPACKTKFDEILGELLRSKGFYDTTTAGATTTTKSSATSTAKSRNKCSNAVPPRINCSTITEGQCKSEIWRTIINVDCPTACGPCIWNETTENPTTIVTETTIGSTTVIIPSKPEPFFIVGNSSTEPITYYHGMDYVRECLKDLLNESKDNRDFFQFFNGSDIRKIMEQDNKSKECFENHLPAKKKDYWPYGYMATEAMRACQYIQPENGGGAYIWTENAVEVLKNEGEKSCLFADYAQTCQDYAQLNNCVFEKLPACKIQFNEILGELLRIKGCFVTPTTTGATTTIKARTTTSSASSSKTSKATKTSNPPTRTTASRMTETTTTRNKCSNAVSPRINCSTIIEGQCKSEIWRTIINVDCPTACGPCIWNETTENPTTIVTTTTIGSTTRTPTTKNNAKTTTTSNPPTRTTASTMTETTTTRNKCSNAVSPRINCSTIIEGQCKSEIWRTIINVDCPTACGPCIWNETTENPTTIVTTTTIGSTTRTPSTKNNAKTTTSSITTSTTTESSTIKRTNSPTTSTPSTDKTSTSTKTSNPPTRTTASTMTETTTTRNKCSNAISPRINCSTIIEGQCKSEIWRTIINVDCPTACGPCIWNETTENPTTIVTTTTIGSTTRTPTTKNNAKTTTTSNPPTRTTASTMTETTTTRNKCSNAVSPRINCSTITEGQCKSEIWRTIINVDCPMACGPCIWNETTENPTTIVTETTIGSTTRTPTTTTPGTKTTTTRVPTSKTVRTSSEARTTTSSTTERTNSPTTSTPSTDKTTTSTNTPIPTTSTEPTTTTQHVIYRKNCSNSNSTKYNCSAISENQCRDAIWRTLIEVYCPTACGLCIEIETTKNPATIVTKTTIGSTTKRATTNNNDKTTTRPTPITTGTTETPKPTEPTTTTQHVIYRKNCSNSNSTKYNCSAISEYQCKDAIWRTLIEVYCPTACGICIENETTENPTTIVTETTIRTTRTSTTTTSAKTTSSIPTSTTTGASETPKPTVTTTATIETTKPTVKTTTTGTKTTTTRVPTSTAVRTSIEARTTTASTTERTSPPTTATTDKTTTSTKTPIQTTSTESTTTQHVITRKNCSNSDSKIYNCSAISEDQCKDAKWRKLFDFHCPNACGVCIEHVIYRKNCSNSDSKIYNCSAISEDQCNNAKWRKLFDFHCPNACGVCIEHVIYRKNCSNSDSKRYNCSAISEDQCNNAKWRTLFDFHCPNACGVCIENATTENPATLVTKTTIGSTKATTTTAITTERTSSPTTSTTDKTTTSTKTPITTTSTESTTTQHVITRKNCSNSDSTKYNCSAISEEQCRDTRLRDTLDVDCPNACGVCIECNDQIAECENDLSICTEPEFNDFANTYCKATCGRCSPSEILQERDPVGPQ